MARKRNSVSEVELSKLKHDIQSRIDFEIQFSKDCLKLSELIYQETKSYISASTVRRIWGFEKSDFSLSYATMDILRNFARVQNMPNTNWSEKTKFILDFFNPLHFEAIDENDKIFQASCRRVAMLLRNDRDLFNEVSSELASSFIGRKFYFELFPDYEFLKSGQEKGFETYLIHSKSIQDKVYGHSILFLAAYLNGQKEKMEFHCSATKDVLSKGCTIHPFVLGRYFFMQIIGSENDERIEWINDAIRYERKIPRSDIGEFKEFPGFHYFVCDALRIVEDWKNLDYMSLKALSDFVRYPEFEWKGYYQQLELFHGISLFQNDKKAEAKSLLKNISPEGFYFISDNYFREIFEFWRKRILM